MHYPPQINKVLIPEKDITPGETTQTEKKPDQQDNDKDKTKTTEIAKPGFDKLKREADPGTTGDPKTTKT